MNLIFLYIYFFFFEKLRLFLHTFSKVVKQVGWSLSHSHKGQLLFFSFKAELEGEGN